MKNERMSTNDLENLTDQGSSGKNVRAIVIFDVQSRKLVKVLKYVVRILPVHFTFDIGIGESTVICLNGRG